MENFSLLIAGLLTALQPVNLVMLIVGLTVGFLSGTVPGISAANGIALMIPVVLSFGFSPATALILYAGIYYGSKYGGRVAAILLDSDGDPGSAATRLDGYPLAASGKSGLALGVTALSSFCGTFAAAVGLTVMFEFFPAIAERFGPPEYVVIILFVFSLILILSATSITKTLLSLFLGLTISTVGLDWATGVLRFTFGVPDLFDGIDFMVVVIGVFALSEAFMLIGRDSEPNRPFPVQDRGGAGVAACLAARWPLLRSTVVGFLIGILPGTGSYVANLAAYRLEKRCAGNDKNEFGGGDLRGVIAPEAANSASAVGSFVPLLALGIPGSATTAVLLGALLMMNIDPSPAYYARHPGLIWALIGSIYIGNTLLFLFNLRMARFFPWLLQIPPWVLMPTIVVISFVSVYAVQQSMISLLMMLLIGMLAYGLRVYRYPLAPLVLGYVLGKPLEDNFRISLAISGGDYSILVTSTVSWLLWIAILLVLAMKALQAWKTSRRTS